MAEYSKFKSLLDEHHSWPGEYTFKFIVPSRCVPEVLARFSAFRITTRASAKGTYTSCTLTSHFANSQKVIDVYTQASEIDGVIML